MFFCRFLSVLLPILGLRSDPPHVCLTTGADHVLDLQLEATGQRALDILQSELFLLKVMSVTLSCRWQRRSAVHKSSGESSNDFREGTGSPTPSSYNSQSKNSSKRGTHFSTPSLSLEAPPLDENCARWLVSVMILLLRQAAPRDDVTKTYNNLSPDADLYGFESIDSDDGLRHDDDMPWIPPSGGDAAFPGHLPHKSPSLTSVSSNASSPIPLARSALGFQRTPRTLTMSSLPLYSLITEWAGNVVYLLSAANWGVVLSKIRGKIHTLARSSLDETQDYTDLQLMQHCALDRNRLVLILQGKATRWMSEIR